MTCRCLHSRALACVVVALASTTAACDFGDDNASVDGGNVTLDASFVFDSSVPDGGTAPAKTPEGGDATANAGDATFAEAGDAGTPVLDGGLPAPGACMPTGSMVVPRSLFSVAPLPDGRILVGGGETLTADIYDPTTGTFSAAAPPVRFFFNYPNGFIPLPDGTILAIGGAAPSCLSSANPEIYDPATSTWSSTVGTMNVPRHNSIPVALADGRVLVMGGYDENTACGVTYYTSITSAEIYDPLSGTFALTASMATPRAASWAVRLLDGRIFVAGGEEHGNDSYNQTAEIFSLAPDAGADAGTFTSAGTVPGTTSTGDAAMQAYVLPDGRVLISNVGTWSIYDPAGGSFTVVAVDPIQSIGWGIALKSGDIFLAGGKNGGTPTAQTELYSPSRGGWIALGTTLALRQLPALAELPNGYVLVAGGNDINGSGQATAEICNPLPPTDAGVVSADAGIAPVDSSTDAPIDASPDISVDAPAG
jgi:hypothetical protein